MSATDEVEIRMIEVIVGPLVDPGSLCRKAVPAIEPVWEKR